MWQSTITRLAQETAASLSPSAMAAAGIKDPRYYVKASPDPQTLTIRRHPGRRASSPPAVPDLRANFTAAVHGHCPQ